MGEASKRVMERDGEVRRFLAVLIPAAPPPMIATLFIFFFFFFFFFFFLWGNEVGRCGGSLKRG